MVPVIGEGAARLLLDVRLAAVYVDVDPASGRATAIERIELRETDGGGNR